MIPTNAKPTTNNPKPLPPLNAILNPSFKLLVAPQAARVLAFVLIRIPVIPAKLDSVEPIMYDIAVAAPIPQLVSFVNVNTKNIIKNQTKLKINNKKNV